MNWSWRYELSDGTEVSPLPEIAIVDGFPSQADAESWIGEMWRELLDAGIASVSLREGDRIVYGPMGLSES
jgi:hypothetical protein